MFGRRPPESTSSTFPVSGWLSSGEAAIAVPMIEVPGQVPASKLAGGHRKPSRLTFGARSGGTSTVALIRPASSASWLIDVLALVRFPTVAPPTAALNVGEKSRAAQLVVVKLAVPVAVAPLYGTAVKPVVLMPQEVGFRMNGLPVPGAVPNRVMS